MQWPQRPQCISHNFYTLQSTQWPIEPYEQKWEDYQKLYSSKSKIVLVKIFYGRNKKSVDMYFVYVYVLIIMPKKKTNVLQIKGKHTFLQLSINITEEQQNNFFCFIYIAPGHNSHVGAFLL